MPSRRTFIKYGLIVAGMATIPVVAQYAKRYDIPGLSAKPDSNGLLLPPNATSRIIARSGYTVEKSDYIWHSAPDGGGVIGTDSGGWIYTSNSEMKNAGGGVGAIRFSKHGEIETAYSILSGSHRNCGGCFTPWRTWLSCEEINKGVTWECDPHGVKAAEAKPALGLFKHESIIFDPDSFILYLTEDKGDSGFYRYIPDSVKKGKADLNQGVLEIALVNNKGDVTWERITDPQAKQTPLRHQVKGNAKFNGGEGIVYRDGSIYFDTKGDDRVWEYKISSGKMSIFYDAADYEKPVLTGVDTIAVLKDHLLICEDDGDMQIVAISPQKEIKPILQLTGHDKSEITGLAFSPDKKRLYFNSQRGETGKSRDAVTYEVMGEFV